jgi:hypothetical protein
MVTTISGHHHQWSPPSVVATISDHHHQCMVTTPSVITTISGHHHQWSPPSMITTHRPKNKFIQFNNSYLPFIMPTVRTNEKSNLSFSNKDRQTLT